MTFKNKVLTLSAVLLLSGISGAIFYPAIIAYAKTEKKTLYSFVYLGCNRLDRHDEQLFPSSANVPQLKQTFEDISKLTPTPGLFIFVGDLVVNEIGDDGATLNRQLNAWTPLYTNSPLAAQKNETVFIPIMGNHESDVYSSKYNYEYPNSANAKIWIKWMEKNGFDTFAGNGPGKNDMQPDSLVENNNQKLTYSFNKGTIHFIVLNTDTFTTTPSEEHPELPTNGWVAYNWVKKDLEKAEKDSSISHIVVLGHKPLASTDSDTNIINTVNHPLAKKLTQLFADSKKFTAYFCAHSHSWNYQVLKPESGQGSVPQVIAGNAGSPLTPTWKPKGGVYFGFTEVRIYQDGTTGIISYRRPVPAPYDSSTGVEPATPMKEIILPAH